MPVFTLDNELSFPPVHLAEPDGLLAIGGDLSTTRLLTAYRNGIFPWYEDEVPLWWCPDPRFVLFPDKLKINKTTKALLKRNEFEFSINTAFKEVIHHCKNVIRPGQEGTWITPEVEKAYCKLYELGHAHSAEVWKNNKLVGGLYGIKMGKVFFGESMFSIESNASRFAFTKYVHQLIAEQVELIDCQIYSDYLESMGAEMIPRTAFTQLLQNLLPK
ncbi:MAG TPA: leucyl/phenylalanyl-tRNA--protein transferase [Chitinophagaceae bacterium]|jgi:leucyl/phenylalanyl-tRNA--protein transferase|nr:leucyl/phenylalanyl-tRNA--protein transferase [Chitinophagaceae bacterium]OPZ17954.1 MAG: Leucyl/phenylalanyl-tRNA--protein transferase [Bacteroidetes bacterium ADurb.BinA245]HNA92015.1 leucyl/phenylalanyl-tRNA--protein transferase [Chitinophagaceae bacterium]HNA95805.1 leucyl/phenylalanyl-tRNA--protein transferase [Chitinophagaceae bacterium]HNF46351.1 leucyl/phenylalanyl-tRNA--protein transferase [Chitinophagaceae bacterium]